MEEKVSKLIRTALNNRNSNEASQALKLAAVIMQKNNLNPNSYLVDVNDVEDLEILRKRVTQLEQELCEAKGVRHSSSELREAKAIAVKWYRQYEEAIKQQEEFHSIEADFYRVKKNLLKDISKLEERVSNYRIIFLFLIATIAIVAYSLL